MKLFYKGSCTVNSALVSLCAYRNPDAGIPFVGSWLTYLKYYLHLFFTRTFKNNSLVLQQNREAWELVYTYSTVCLSDASVLYFFSWSRIDMIPYSHADVLSSASSGLYSFKIVLFLANYKAVCRYPSPWHYMKRLVLYQIPVSRKAVSSFCSQYRSDF